MKRKFSNKRIVLGVSGSIAAYKACELASRLVEYGAHLQVAMTRSATELVGSATFEAITGGRVVTQMFEPLQNPEVEHIRVALNTDLFIIAPATANILAKMANGIADDWLTTTLLATRAPILVAPAMNTNMYSHPATQANIETLKSRGAAFVGPDSGRLACRTVGPGRLIDPAAILEAALPLLSDQKELSGKRVIITSGGTHEAIDPVRFIGNRSSGKMGRAIALEAYARGADVTVISGPAETPLPYAIEVVRVESAREMAAAVEQHAPTADIFIAAAAVADYRPGNALGEKHKRGNGGLDLSLVENPDILAAVGAAKRPGQIIVGFAAETENLEQHARQKLEKKKLDLVVANEVAGEHSAFGSADVNALILGANGASAALSLQSKEDLAIALFDRIAELL
jgi:phosphopantothenoylcysteine decarboxylase / phosphopantothenate---cysteine ligase